MARLAHRMGWLVLFVTASVLVLSPIAALAADHDADLGQVLDGEFSDLSVTVSGIGGYYGECMGTTFVNDSAETVYIRVPVGMRLVPPDSGVQTMVTAGGEILEVPPGQSEHVFTAFCSEMDDGSPSGSTDFSNGGMVEDRQLQAVLDRIARDESTSQDAQGAVWSVTDGLDISANEEAQNFIPPEQVPPGKAAAGGAAAGLAGLSMAEIMRRMSEIKGGKTPGAGATTTTATTTTTTTDLEDISEFEQLLESDETDVADVGTKEVEPLDPDGDKLYQDPEKKPDQPEGDGTDATKEPDKAEKKPKPPPKPPKAPRAGDSEQGMKWDRERKRVVVNDGVTNFEAGKGGFWLGVGQAPGAGTNPFELKPPGTDVSEGGFSARSRGNQVSATVETGDGKDPVHIFRDGSSDTTRVQRGHFVLSQQGNRTSIQDRINGRRTGASYDGSTNDFNLFRDNFQLSRTGDTYSVFDKTPGGRDVGASYDTRTGDFSAQSGNRTAVRSGDTYGYQWGDRGVMYDSSKNFGAYEFPTDGGKGSLTVGAGSEGQYGVSRTQPLKLGNRDARLNLEYSRMLRDSGGGMENDFTAGLDVGKVSVNWSPGDKPRVSYNVKF